MSVSKERPFRFNGTLSLFPLASLNTAVETLLERVTGLDHLDRLYQAQPTIAPQNFAQHVLDLLRVRCTVGEVDLHRVPRQGGAILVANHPFGALEGIILAALLSRPRPDVKFMANFLLTRVPELRPYFIAVDPFGQRGAKQRNISPLREAVRHVRRGGLLVVFPAGEVSHLQLQRRRVADPHWSSTIARLVRLTEAPVVPAFFEGANGALFQSLGLLHPRVRTALLPRELLNKADRNIRLRIGEPVPYTQLRTFTDDDEMTSYLRLRTYALGGFTAVAPQVEKLKGRGTDLPPVAQPVSPALLAAEVGALPVEQCLDRSGNLAVYCAKSDQIPALMQELGRLRELTFRRTGEGTGKARDIDLYDAYYRHLFVWNTEVNEVVGAYRLGLSDEILARFGKKGFYSHSLFKYSTKLLKEISPAIELGRSFVRPEYQRSYSPLLLLWKGIGRFVATNPRYRVLFGPVSISNDYENSSQQLLVEFLRANNYLPDLARHVKPRRPFRSPDSGLSREEIASLRDVDQLSDTLSSIERDGKGVPILIKQYLKLGGRLLGFNVDPDFSDALDGLIMVDLSQTDLKVLARYMGKDEAHGFIAYHTVAEQRSA